MRVNGTLINYYFHCKRQCYLHGNRLNLEDNSEIVQIGKAIHEERLQSSNSEIAVEKNKSNKKVVILELTEERENELKKIIESIEKLLNCQDIPERLNKSGCKKCAYYEYCYI